MQFSFIEFEKHNFCVSSKDCSIEVNKLHFYRKTKKTSGTKTKEAAQPKSICCPKEVSFLQTIKDFLIKKKNITIITIIMEVEITNLTSLPLCSGSDRDSNTRDCVVQVHDRNLHTTNVE